MDVFLPDESRTCHACRCLVPVEAVECGICAADVTPQAVKHYVSLRLAPVIGRLRQRLLVYAVGLTAAGAIAGLLMDVATTPGKVVVASLAVSVVFQVLLARKARDAPIRVAWAALVAVAGLHVAIALVRPGLMVALSLPSLPYVGAVLRALLAGKEAALLSRQIADRIQE